MVPACPAEMLPTLGLKRRRLPILMGSLQVRSVMFVTGIFCFQVRLYFPYTFIYPFWRKVQSIWGGGGGGGKGSQPPVKCFTVLQVIQSMIIFYLVHIIIILDFVISLE